MDTRTEALIQDAMERLREGRTSFIIAHRLSTVRNATTILVMEAGDVVESGTHEELLAAGAPTPASTKASGPKRLAVRGYTAAGASLC